MAVRIISALRNGDNNSMFFNYDNNVGVINGDNIFVGYW